MKYYIRAILALFAIAVMLAACSRFDEEEPMQFAVEERFLVLPSEELAMKSGTSLKDLHVGFGVWMRECGKCHEHVFPDDVSIEIWHVMTPKMAWNANISDAEKDALLKYILAAKCDPSELDQQF